MTDDRERSPQEWRDLLRTSYDYPEEVKEGRRKARRRARREHRQADRRRTAEQIRQQRRREPITVVGAAVVVAVLLLMGACARFGPDWVRGSGATPKPAASQSTPADDAKPPAPASGSPSASASASPSPSTSADRSEPGRVAEAFVRQYLTRDPLKDETHRPAVERAAPWATPALTQNLAETDDPAFDKLVSRGGVAQVSAVKVEPAGGTLPPDTPLRVWRTVRATVNVQGYTAYTETTVIQVEVTRTASGWLVSAVLGV